MQRQTGHSFAAGEIGDGEATHAFDRVRPPRLEPRGHDPAPSSPFTPAAAQPAPVYDERTVRGFAIIAALVSLDLRHGRGAHPLRLVVELTGMPTGSVCRLLRLAETKYHLVYRPATGYYALTELGRASAGAHSPLDDPEVFQPHALLADLSANTGAGALLYGATHMVGLSRRHLLSHELGVLHSRVTGAPQQDQAALIQAPLTVDAAGQVILAHSGLGRALPPTARWGQNPSMAHGRSPLRGLQFLAAPVWSGRHVAGALSLLFETDWPVARKVAVSGDLAAAAASYSREATVYAAHLAQRAAS